MWRSEFNSLIRLSFPILLGNLGAAAMQLTDTIMLARLGPDELAAGGLGGHFAYFIFLFCYGVTLAVTPFITHSRGRNPHDVRGVRQAVGQASWAALIVSIPLSAILWDLNWLLLLTGQTETVSESASLYLRYFLFAIPLMVMFNLLRCFVSALERPRATAVITVVAIGVNIIGNYALIFGHFGFPALGLKGAALATIISAGFQLLALIIFIAWDRRLRRYRIFSALLEFNGSFIRRVLKAGIPIGLILLIEIAFFTALALLIGRLGTEPLAAHQIAIQVVGLTLMVPLAISQAASIRVGMAAGNGDAKRIWRSSATAFSVGTVLMGLVGIGLWLGASTITSSFLGSAEPVNGAVGLLAQKLLIIAALFQIFDGTQTIFAGALRGLRDTTVPLFLATAGYWGIGIPLAIALGFGLEYGAEGLWIGIAAALAAVAILLLARFQHVYRKACKNCQIA